MRDEDTVVRGIAISRKHLVELIVIAILLAFGINLIAGQLLNVFNEKPLIVALIGSFLCLASLAYAFHSLIGSRTKQKSIEAFLAYNPIEKELIPIARYQFSECLAGYLHAAFAENPALKLRWENQSLEPYEFLVPTEDGSLKKVNHETMSKMRIPIDGTTEAFLPEDGTFAMHFNPLTASENDTVKLILEAMEYFLLEKLSAELNRHFNNEQFSEKHLSIYVRNDIPAVLLSNKFLELFTRPTSERPAFVEEIYKQADEDTDKELFELISYKFGGSRYTKFRLILPKGSKVTRPSEHVIEIETKKVKIRLAVRFTGALAAISHEFRNYYIGNTNLFELADYSAYIDILISVKWHAMLSSTGWSYYHWIDSFLDEIEKSASKKVFFNHIGWETTLTFLQCLDNSATKSNTQEGLEGYPNGMTITTPTYIKKSQN